MNECKHVWKLISEASEDKVMVQCIKCKRFHKFSKEKWNMIRFSQSRPEKIQPYSSTSDYMNDQMQKINIEKEL